MLGAHVSRTPPKLVEVAPDLQLPANLEEVLARGLAKASAERYTNAIEYIGALDAVIAGVPLASSSAPEHLGIGQTGTMAVTADSSIMMEVVPGTATPVHGVYRLPDGRVATPMNLMRSSPVATAPTVDLAHASGTIERQTRAVSLADLPPLPRRWYIVGAIVVGVGILIAILAAIFSGDDASPNKSSQTPKPVVLPVPVKTVDKEMVLKALLHDLQTGKTCADRKAVIPKLVDLDDPRAIEPLRKARYRMVGGLLGIGADNANYCLKADAEAAIKELGGTIR